MIAIKPSTIHGNGVFATQDIPENTFITNYPDTFKISHKLAETLKGSKYEHYILSIDKDTNIYGDPDSKDLTQCGHIINDVYKPKIPENPTEPDWVECCVDYYIHSTRKSNVELGEKITSKKLIQKDTELLVTYGYPYWVCKITGKPLPTIVHITSYILNQKHILKFISEAK